MKIWIAIALLVALSGCLSSQPPAQGANTVAIKNFAFSPQTLTVKAGTTVTWTNADSAIHTVTSEAFQSGNLATGGSFEFTFSTPGTYDYSCGIHPTMKGSIVVEQ